MNWRTWLLPTGTALIGLIIGLWINQQSVPVSASVERSVTPSDAPIAVVPTNAVCVTNSVASLADVRLIVREELAALTSSMKLAGSTLSDKRGRQNVEQGEKKEPISPGTTQLAAASRAQSVVDVAIAHRQWTERDAEQFRTEFDLLTDEQRTEILQKFTVAVNKGQIVPQTDRIPF